MVREEKVVAMKDERVVTEETKGHLSLLNPLQFPQLPPIEDEWVERKSVSFRETLLI